MLAGYLCQQASCWKAGVTVLETWVPNFLLLTSLISPLGCFWTMVVVPGTYSTETLSSHSKRADMGSDSNLLAGRMP